MGTPLARVHLSVEAIREDREHGATSLALQALEALRLAVQAHPQPSSLPTYLPEVAVSLVRAKPTMAAIKNVVWRFLAEARRLGYDRHRLLMLAQGLEHRVKKAGEEAAKQAAALVPASGTIITCSYSSSVVRALHAAVLMGKQPHVLAMASLWQERTYGQRIVGDLRQAGVDAEVLPDDRLSQALPRICFALVGADKVLPDGSFVNGTPTLRLASTLHNQAPVYVVAESFKFDSYPSVESGYDLISAGLVVGFVTEAGIVTPEDLQRGRTVQFGAE